MNTFDNITEIFDEIRDELGRYKPSHGRIKELCMNGKRVAEELRLDIKALEKYLGS